MANEEFDTKKVKGYEKFSSTQVFNRFMFKGAEEKYSKQLHEEMCSFTSLPFAAERFSVSDLHTIDEMASSPLCLSFLCFLTKMICPKTVVEIGTFIGFSTANLAYGLADNSKLHSFEKFVDFAEIAQSNIDKLGLADKVILHVGDAKDELPNKCPKHVDLAFIDGNKEDYLFYLNFFEERMTENGIIVIDDFFFHGDIFNKRPTSEKGTGLRKVVDYLKSTNTFSCSVVPISNGMCLLSKRESGK